VQQRVPRKMRQEADISFWERNAKKEKRKKKLHERNASFVKKNYTHNTLAFNTTI
jgi:hypothetical protein